jgi:hypothetical protein
VVLPQVGIRGIRVHLSPITDDVLIGDERDEHLPRRRRKLGTVVLITATGPTD